MVQILMIGLCIPQFSPFCMSASHNAGYVRHSYRMGKMGEWEWRDKSTPERRNWGKWGNGNGGIRVLQREGMGRRKLQKDKEREGEREREEGVEGGREREKRGCRREGKYKFCYEKEADYFEFCGPPFL